MKNKKKLRDKDIINKKNLIEIINDDRFRVAIF